MRVAAMAENRAPVAPGHVLLGKYRVEATLGRGGMGIVVAARHLELGELFAIKLLLHEACVDDAGSLDDTVVARFVREARACARLKSEHVARVVDVGRLDDGTPYMLMEHLDGSDLRKVLRARHPLPIDDAVGYVLQACEAVAEAHSLGIVHRDLKPSNMFLIARPDGTPCVKVLDFGISKQLGDGGQAGDLTQSGALLGTPHYMAPEQMTRTKEVDRRSDIWAIGVVLFELLSGVRPFQGGALTEILAQVLQQAPPRLSELRADIPPGLERIVLTCLEKDPGRRHQTIHALAQALAAEVPGALAANAPLAASSQRGAALAPIHSATVASVPVADASSAPTLATLSDWGRTAGGTGASRDRRVALAVAVALAIGGVVAGSYVLRDRAPDRSTFGHRAAHTSVPAARSSAPAPGLGSPPEVDRSPVPSAEPTASSRVRAAVGSKRLRAAASGGQVSSAAVASDEPEAVKPVRPAPAPATAKHESMF